MKKDILFIISTLRCGGAEHALVSLLNVFDYNKYNVDLLVLCEKGMFYKENIPKPVNIVRPDLSEKAILEPSINIMVKCLLTGHWKYIYIHIKRLLKNYFRTSEIKGNFWSNYWKDYQKYIIPLEKKYDVSIGYLEGLSNYYCIDKVYAKRKIGWMHTNYLDSNQNYEMDQIYFNQFDYMVTMSEPATDTLKKAFPELQKRIHTIHNILDEKEVLRLAKEKVEDVEKNKDGITIVSVGNILPAKGYDMAVEVCAKLIENGKNIKWYIVGREDQKDKINVLINKFHVEDSFILLGMKKNPYKYIEMADIYVQCSRFEGFSTTIREAKLLCKPIVATNCQGINDQIINGKNGKLVEGNVDSIYTGILEVINHEELRKSFEKTLKDNVKRSDDTKKELKKLYELIG
ncbi:glycosyltransferase [Bariatricus sp. SGI.019]|uniref:glycosyltransferase n=1 Tax=Bariatricus sp. SGI.019 TaxID=3420548 RepID=UPI003D00A361